MNVRRTTRKRQGSGVLNTLINKLPFEAHLPGYQYCGPGTKLAKRLARGDKGINALDAACREHDIAYSQHNDMNTRHQADKKLAEAALKRMQASDASWGEKLAALGITGAMKAKQTLGMGLKRRKKKQRKSKKGGLLNFGVKKTAAKKKRRIIPTPKRGGFLPLLLPILGAIGALGGGAAGIAKAVNDAKANKEQLEEQKRHNLALEAAAKGKGLYLKPYKGYGHSKNCQ